MKNIDIYKNDINFQEIRKDRKEGIYKQLESRDLILKNL